MSERYSARMSARYKSSGSATRSSRIERDRGQRTEDRGSWVKSVRGFLGQFSMHRHLGDVVESPTMHAESSTIEHLDEDWQPRCTTRAVNLRTGVERTCTAPAKWFHVCGVCSLDGYSCDRCRRHAIERARCYGCMRWIADYWVWRPL